MRNLNKPPRYNVASIQAQQTLGGDVMQSHEEGQYVEWRDYAWLLTEKQRLDAEVERLRIAGSESEPRFVLLSDYRHLKVEVERLTKAGDAMAEIIKPPSDCDTWIDERVAVNEWNAAKEGKQS